MEQNQESPEPVQKNEGQPAVEQQVCNKQAGASHDSPGSKEINKDARMWAMVCHLAGLGGMLLPGTGNIVAPLVVWQIKKEGNPFIDEQGKEAVNFQISVSMYLIISIFLCVICVGAFLVAAVLFFFFVFSLIAAVKANNGFHYRYPLCIRFIK